MADEEHQCTFGWLLQDLQQRVGPGPVQIVDGVDDSDPPASLACRRAKKWHGAPDVINRDLLMENASVIDGAFDNEKIGLRLRGNAPADRIFRVDFERGRNLRFAQAGSGISEDKARHTVGERRLADTLRAGEQKTVRHSRRAVGRKQRRLSLRVAEKHCRRTRMLRLAVILVAILSRHRATPVASFSPPVPLQPAEAAPVEAATESYSKPRSPPPPRQGLRRSRHNGPAPWRQWRESHPEAVCEIPRSRLRSDRAWHRRACVWRVRCPIQPVRPKSR